VIDQSCHGRFGGAIVHHRDVVIGVKARLSNNIAGTNDLEGLRRAQEAAAPFNLLVMIHMANRSRYPGRRGDHGAAGRYVRIC